MTKLMKEPELNSCWLHRQNMSLVLRSYKIQTLQQWEDRKQEK